MPWYLKCISKKFIKGEMIMEKEFFIKKITYDIKNDSKTDTRTVEMQT